MSYGMPSIVIQELVAAATYAGANDPSDGTSTPVVSLATKSYGGRMWIFEGLTAGGKFLLPMEYVRQWSNLERRDLPQDRYPGKLVAADPVGATLHRVFFKGTGTTRVQGFIHDPDGFEYEFLDTNKGLPYSATAIVDPTSFHWAPTEALFVPPGWEIRFTSTGALAADGRLGVHFTPGWTIMAGQTTSQFGA